MSFPLDALQAKYIISKRFGIRSAKAANDGKGAAYALDEGQNYKIDETYMNWDYHLSNTIALMTSFPNYRTRTLLFMSPVYGVAERYNSDGVGDKKTFPKANAVSNAIIHASTPLDQIMVRLMEWVFNCIDTYGPI